MAKTFLNHYDLACDGPGSKVTRALEWIRQWRREDAAVKVLVYGSNSATLYAVATELAVTFGAECVFSWVVSLTIIFC